jgi:branched-subunit amino acid transport protein
MTGQELLMVAGMAIAVYLPKVVPLVVVSERLTDRLRPWLRYVAPAVLGALVAPSIVQPSSNSLPGWSQLPFLVAFAAALLTRRMVQSLAAGLVAILVVTLFLR